MMVGLLALSGCAENRPSSSTDINPITVDHEMLYLPQALLAPATPVAATWEGTARGVVLPHHLPFAQALLYGFYQQLQQAKPGISTFIIVGPDHGNRGQGIATMRDGFQMPLGTVRVQQDIVNNLVSNNQVSLERDVFEDEHSIIVQLPFIQHFFPEAQIVPIVLRSDLSLVYVQDFAVWLAENLPDDTFVICSTDLSHYKPRVQADQEDDATIAVLESMEIERIDDVHIDSPPSATVLLAMMKVWGSEEGIVLGRANSADAGADPNSTTGYGVVVYAQ
jgi:AmmeMemoRadiSam system protein B